MKDPLQSPARRFYCITLHLLSRTLIRRYVTNERVSLCASEQQQNTELQRFVLCVSFCNSQKYFQGVWGSHHCFPWQRKVLSLFTNRPHTPTSRLERNENKTFQRRLWNIVPVLYPLPLSLKPRLSHLTPKILKVDSEKRSFQHSFHFSGWSRWTCAIKSQSHPLACSHVFVSSLRWNGNAFFLLLLSCFCCYEPGKAGSAKTKYMESFFLKQRKTYS